MGMYVCICIPAGINTCITSESNKHELSTSELGFPLEKEKSSWFIVDDWT